MGVKYDTKKVEEFINTIERHLDNLWQEIRPGHLKREFDQLIDVLDFLKYLLSKEGKV